MLTPERINEIAIEAGFTKTLDGAALVVPSPHHDARPYVLKLARAIEQAARREALEEASSPVYDKSVVKRLAVQMGLIHEIKADTIERCAKVCEDRIMRDNSDEDLLAQRCADAIRALLKSDGN